MIARFVNKSVKSVILLAFVSGVFTMWGYGGPEKELKKNRPPNIVFILADNQPASAVGCYGNPDIKTPHIDQLAKEGIRFTNVYAANGVCSPTRATLMTGLMPSQHGVHDWLDDSLMPGLPDYWCAIPEFRTIAITLENRGYQTALIGKWHLGHPKQPKPGFDYWLVLDRGDLHDFRNNCVYEKDRENAITVKGDHIVDYFTQKAVEYIKNYKDKDPFYLQLNYDGPYTCPPANVGPAKNRHYQDYANKPLLSFPREPINDSIMELVRSLLKHDPCSCSNDSQKLKDILVMNEDHDSWANIASENTMVDDGVGAVIEALKKKGLYENTLIIYSSDQGNYMGQHGLWTHTIATIPSTLYTTALRVPFIVKPSGGKKWDPVNDMMIGQYDIPITITDYLGFGDVVYENSPGRSFAPILRGEKKINDWHGEVYFEQEETRGIRTPTYSYWKRMNKKMKIGEPVLYDLSMDPAETRNVVYRPDYREVKKNLDAQLEKFFSKYVDPQYDLWNGGTAKGSVSRIKLFRELYGPGWQPITKMKPRFKEDKK
jgi:arylsulfatase A-like enzyme